MARPGAAAAQCRSLHRICGADARSEDRRPGAAARVPARLLLYRCARLAKTPAKRGETPKAQGGKDSDIARLPAPNRLAGRRGAAVEHRGGTMAESAHERGAPRGSRA